MLRYEQNVYGAICAIPKIAGMRGFYSQIKTIKQLLFAFFTQQISFGQRGTYLKRDKSSQFPRSALRTDKKRPATYERAQDAPT